ncbi:MAG: RidA family protein [Phycisphaerae bacterium]|jgi:enamine deaminase RidA (YjgF/YER057c/UK114 family)|nr:RidA family protein [Phycisphaerae bacterium]
MDSTDLPTTATVNRETAPGMQLVSLKSSSIEELFITADLRGRDLAGVVQNVMNVVKDKNATVVTQTIFAPMGQDNSSVSEGKEAIGECDWPVTWIDSGHRNGSPLGGMHIHAVSGADIERIILDDRTVGSVFQDDSARYCYLGDLWSGDRSASRTEQADQTFDMMEAAIKLGGMEFSNIVRTWLYLDELLQWYDPFNRVRDDFFRQRGVFDALVPASTGISGANPAGAAVIAGAMGVQVLNDSVTASPLPSPLQCPALEYGSSFSRAIELSQPHCKRVVVSGTASIEPGGKTVYLDDVPGQIDLTMRVVFAILESRGASWSDVTRAIAYFKCEQYRQDYVKYCDENEIPDMPTIITENDICRDDLLFEIELDAIVSAK